MLNKCPNCKKLIKYTNEKLYRFPKKEDGKSFRTKGKKFI